jgi:hypothetical protein
LVEKVIQRVTVHKTYQEDVLNVGWSHRHIKALLDEEADLQIIHFDTCIYYRGKDLNLNEKRGLFLN